MTSVTLANWNVAWKSPKGLSARIIRQRIFERTADILCLTEATLDFPPTDGHVVAAEADYGYPIVEGRRKVLLWSRAPWRAVDSIGEERLPSGRFVRGVTDTPLGPITVVGICIPWFLAHVTSGRRDREPWEDHVDFVRRLGPLLRSIEGPTIVTGDFNQRIPRIRGNAEAQQLLLEALGPLSLATLGKVEIDREPEPRATIDHVAHDSRLAAACVRGISNRHEGRLLSDHFGVAVRFTLPTKFRPS